MPLVFVLVGVKTVMMVTVVMIMNRIGRNNSCCNSLAHASVGQFRLLFLTKLKFSVRFMPDVFSIM